MGLDRRLVGLLMAGFVFVGLAASAAAKAGVVVYEGNPMSLTKSVAAQTLGKKGVKQISRFAPGINDFFLHTVTVSVGEKVTFINTGFHDVDLPPKGQGDFPLVIQHGTVSGANDAAGNPFWFNGKPSFMFNPPLFAASGGTTYDGTSRIDSGLPLGPSKPLTVTFTKAGMYKFFCDIHRDMSGTIVVKPRGKPVPTPAQDKALLVKQLKTDILEAKALETAKVPKDTVDIGETAANGVELYAMFPVRLTVKSGTVVTFTLTKNEREFHSATFGPAAYLKPLQPPGPGGSVPPVGLYPSDQTRPLVLAPSSHGNGFANTGFLSRDPSYGLPVLGKIKFTTPGIYKFICLIHPFMHGEIVVK
jgi:plastocyanin